MSMSDHESVLTHTVAARLLDLLAETTTLPDLLTGICELTVEVVPDCTTTSITVIMNGVPATLASFDERAVRVDKTQYRAGEGPCLEACRTDETVLVDDVTAGDGAWRRTAREAGLLATLSVPIPAGRTLAAGINIYSDRPGWSDESVLSAEILATYAGDALTVASRMVVAAQSSSRGGATRPSTMSPARSSGTRSPA